MQHSLGWQTPPATWLHHQNILMHRIGCRRGVNTIHLLQTLQPTDLQQRMCTIRILPGAIHSHECMRCHSLCDSSVLRSMPNIIKNSASHGRMAKQQTRSSFPCCKTSTHATKLPQNTTSIQPLITVYLLVASSDHLLSLVWPSLCR